MCNGKAFPYVDLCACACVCVEDVLEYLKENLSKRGGSNIFCMRKSNIFDNVNDENFTFG